MTEAELYRYLDVGASVFHTDQTCAISGGRLVFIRQGNGTVSLVLVLGRPDANSPREHEFSIRCAAAGRRRGSFARAAEGRYVGRCRASGLGCTWLV